MTHTPTPWRANHVRGSSAPEFSRASAVWSEDGETPICSVDFSVGRYQMPPDKVRDANARFIAMACTSHDALVAILQRLIPKIEREIQKGGGLFSETELVQARAAVTIPKD